MISAERCLGPDTLFILSYMSTAICFFFLHVACLAAFLFLDSEIIHLYLYISVVWMSSADTLCLYTHTMSKNFLPAFRCGKGESMIDFLDVTQIKIS